MNLLLILTTSAAVFFAAVAIIISIKDDRRKISGDDKTKNKYSSVEEEFVHMMVHELRAPLASIKDSSELLITSGATLREEEKEQFLQIINRQSKSLLTQISSILDAAKFESGNFKLDKKNENIEDIIHERVKIFEPQAAKKSITLSSHIDGPIPLISVDCLRIDQVLNNLLSNSIKFTPLGGKVAIETRVHGHNVEISVTDSGIGIPKELHEKIFSKFYQVRNHELHEDKEGSGLGLYIVKKIIDAHKGEITLESGEGKGTVVRVSLPIEIQKEVAEPVPAQYTMPN